MKYELAILGFFAVIFICTSVRAMSCSVAQFDTNSGVTCNTNIVQKSDIFVATNGFNMTIPDTVTLEIINAASLLGSGTINLPANPQDGQPLTIEAPKGVTLISIVPNSGQTMSVNPPIIMTAATPYRLKWGAATNTWYPN